MEDKGGAFPGLTAREVADALWLVLGGRVAASINVTPSSDVGAHEPGRRVKSTVEHAADRACEARTVRPPDDQPTSTGMAAVGLDAERLAAGPGKRGAPHLDQVTAARAVQHALRPFQELIPSADAWEFDEEATAAGAVLDPRWLPVYRPAYEARWDAVLVVDDGPSMALWSTTVSSFARTLVKQGVFRNVYFRRFGTDHTGGIGVRGTGARAARKGISEVVDPARRRIVLVMTDGVSGMWRSGAAFGALRSWGAAHPVALVHVLAWPIVQRVGLEVHRLRLRSPEAGSPNAHLRWTPQSAAPGVFDDLDDAMPVCVLGLGPVDLERWARMTVTATTWADLGAVLIPRSPDGPRVEVERPTPAMLVGSFRATASPEAFELATHLAAAPLDLEVMSFLRSHLVPASKTEHLTELLGSPLVVDAEPGQGTGEGGQVVFEFMPGVREELLAFGRRTSTLRVRAAVHDHLAEQLPAFREALAGRAGDLEPGVRFLARQFFHAELAAARALSGPYLVEAREIGRLLDEDLHRNTATPPADQVGDSAGGEDSTRPGEGDGGHHEPRPMQMAAVVDRRPQESIRSHPIPPVFGGVPPRNANFTGRDDLLDELGKHLQPGAIAAVLPEALHDMGGVGKSQLAIEYVYRNLEKFDLIWWIPAERTVKIANALVELGAQLKLDVGADSNVAVQSVLDALRGGSHRDVPPNWLLVFDNADSPQAVQQYLPTGGSGQILVTSRNSQWLSTARGLKVAVFHRRESIQLLRRRDPDLPEYEADRLAEALGDLPLAIAQAAAWRAETGMPAAEYLELLQEKQVELLDLGPTVDYPKSVAAAWNLSLSQLNRKNPSALRLLQICAFFAPEPVSTTMFTNSRNIVVEPGLSPVLRDRFRLNDVIRDINRFALARIDHRTNSLEMHRLVQAVLIHQMNDEERTATRHVAHQILGANDPNAPDEAKRWPEYVELHAHIMASDAIECMNEEVRGLLYNQVQFLYWWGETEQSAELAERLYRAWYERLGPNHPETLRVGRWLGGMWWAQCRFEEAAEFNSGLLERHRETFGEEYEGTIEAIDSVAADNRAKGDFETALRLSQRNHENCLRYLGEEDRVTLNAAHNLAVSLRLAGRFADALQLDEATLIRKVQMLGAEHHLSLLTEVGLTIDICECGDYLGARRRHEDLVATYQRQLKAFNPTLLRALRQLAAMRRKAGDHVGALEAAEAALSGLSQRYGPAHAETLAAALSKSIGLRHVGRLDRAEALAEETLAGYARTLGRRHPHTLSAAVNVALLRRALGDYAGAHQLDGATLRDMRTALGGDHPSTLVTAVNTASDLFVLGQAEAAWELDSGTYERAVAILGADHPTTLACGANLAQDMAALGLTSEAERLRTAAVAGLAARLKPDHPAVRHLDSRDSRADCDIDPAPL